MPMRRVVRPFIHFVDWLFAGPVPFFDLFLGLLGAWWLGLMVTHAEVFDRGNLAGMQWLPDRVWIAFVALTAALHGVGLLRPRLYLFRSAACLLTAWYWLMVAISLARLGWSPGDGTYALIGLTALLAGIFVSGRAPPRAA